MTTTTIIIAVLLVVYFAGMPIAHRLLHDETNTKFENIWFVIVWPLALINYFTSYWWKY